VRENTVSVGKPEPCASLFAQPVDALTPASPSSSPGGLNPNA